MGSKIVAGCGIQGLCSTIFHLLGREATFVSRRDRTVRVRRKKEKTGNRSSTRTCLIEKHSQTMSRSNETMVAVIIS